MLDGWSPRGAPPLPAETAASYLCLDKLAHLFYTARLNEAGSSRSLTVGSLHMSPTTRLPSHIGNLEPPAIAVFVPIRFSETNTGPSTGIRPSFELSAHGDFWAEWSAATPGRPSPERPEYQLPHSAPVTRTFASSRNVPLLPLIPHNPSVRMSRQLLPVSPRIVPHCFSIASIAPRGRRASRHPVGFAHPCTKRCKDQSLSKILAAGPQQRGAYPGQGARRTVATECLRPWI
jgi:hypothetical protein